LAKDVGTKGFAEGGDVRRPRDQRLGKGKEKSGWNNALCPRKKKEKWNRGDREKKGKKKLWQRPKKRRNLRTVESHALARLDVRRGGESTSRQVCRGAEQNPMYGGGERGVAGKTRINRPCQKKKKHKKQKT